MGKASGPAAALTAWGTGSAIDTNDIQQYLHKECDVPGMYGNAYNPYRQL